MQVFVFNPRNQEETLRDFNQRLQEYCDAEEVVSIDCETIGSSLIITCVEADDINAPAGSPVLVATMRKIKDGEDIESYLEGVLDKIDESNEGISEDQSETVPIDIRICCRADKVSEGYAVIICVAGIFIGGEEEPQEGDGGPEGDDTPPDDNTPSGYESEKPLGDIKEVQAEVVE